MGAKSETFTRKDEKTDRRFHAMINVLPITPMTPQPFGSLPAGKSVEAYTLANAAGARLQVLTYGGIVTSLQVPDRSGRLADVVLGFDNLEAYAAGHPYFGAIVGRIAGRVSGGRLRVEGHDYALNRNDGANHLHGGKIGFDKRVWTPQPLRRPDGADSLRLTYLSPDGEEGRKIGSGLGDWG